MFIDNKRIGQVGNGLSLISIMDDVNRGEYWSATGDVLLFAAGKTKLSPYLTAIDLGMWMYNTDLMQMRLAASYNKNLQIAIQKLNRYRQQYKANDVDAMESLREQEDKCSKEIDFYYKARQECLQKLGCKY